MSRTMSKDFTCPVCGCVIKSPYTEADIQKHVEEKHANDPAFKGVHQMRKKYG